MSHSVFGEIPQDVILTPLHPHYDSRGKLTEIFREEWRPQVRAVQWNLVHSECGVMRGVHVHRRHFDYLTVVSGSLQLGLCDLRPQCQTFRKAAMVRMSPSEAVLIPPGVAHGFYFPEPSIHVYSVSEYWDPSDELGCHWSDSALGIPWDVRDPVISARDAGLPTLDRLLETLA